MTSRNRNFAVVTLPICAAILLVGAWFAGAGDLNPPVGPVAPTHKTLTEVEPRIAINATNTPGDGDSVFKITAPGSYYLTGNITGVAGKHGIEIAAGGVKFAAGGVTLDLNGFDLLAFVGGTLDGVSATLPLQSNIAVVNGSIRGWGDDGVDLGTLSADNCRVDGVLASGNTGGGIRIGDGSTVSNCSAYQNTGNGINTSSGCTVTDCSANDNIGIGISTSTGSTVTNCSAYSNTGNGISTGVGGTVTNCSAYLNTSSGISVSSGCMVADCTARANTLDGIVCSNDCMIRGNICSINGNTGDGAGIHATLTDNRIEANNCTAADRGIDVDLAANVIIKNTCSDNTTNWTIAANNVCGPILDRTAPGSAAINGNSAPDSTGSTHPNANFSY